MFQLFLADEIAINLGKKFSTDSGSQLPIYPNVKPDGEDANSVPKLQLYKAVKPDGG